MTMRKSHIFGKPLSMVSLRKMSSSALALDAQLARYVSDDIAIPEAWQHKTFYPAAGSMPDLVFNDKYNIFRSWEVSAPGRPSTGRASTCAR